MVDGQISDKTVSAQKAEPTVRQRDCTNYPVIMDIGGSDFMVAGKQAVSHGVIHNKETGDEVPVVLFTLTPGDCEIGVYAPFEAEDFLRFMSDLDGIREKVIEKLKEKEGVN